MENKNEKNTENKTVENQETGTAAGNAAQNPAVEEPKSYCLFTEDTDGLGEDEYRECCGLEPDEEIDDQSYWDWVGDCIRSYWEDFKYECNKHLMGRQVLVTGYSGLWDGTHEIVPTVVCDTAEDCALLNVIAMCQVRGQSETEVLLEPDGTVSVNVTHHDGSNHKTVRLLTPEGARIAEDIAEYGEDSEYRPDQITFEPFTLKHFGQE